MSLPSQTPEEHLWLACTTGDLPTVHHLTNTHQTLQINAIGQDRGDSAFHRACRLGWTPIVQHLLLHPQINVNLGNAGGATGFFLACQEGHREVVAVLRRDQRVDVELQDVDGGSPFFQACQEGRTSVVELLLRDERIDVNRRFGQKQTPFLAAVGNEHAETVALLLRDYRVEVNSPNSQNCTPLWIASTFGRLPVVQLMLSSDREIDTHTKSLSSLTLWDKKTAAQAGRLSGIVEKSPSETEEEFQASQQGGPKCAALIEAYEEDQDAVCQQLRLLPWLRDRWVGELFALVIFLADHFLKIVPPTSTAVEAHQRFLGMIVRLPIELQMVVCNRVFGSPSDLVLTKHSEPNFKLLAAAEWPSS